jgi:hypothetical protein
LIDVRDWSSDVCSSDLFYVSHIAFMELANNGWLLFY